MKRITKNSLPIQNRRLPARVVMRCGNVCSEETFLLTPSIATDPTSFNMQSEASQSSHVASHTRGRFIPSKNLCLSANVQSCRTTSTQRSPQTPTIPPYDSDASKLPSQISSLPPRYSNIPPPSKSQPPLPSHH